MERTACKPGGCMDDGVTVSGLTRQGAPRALSAGFGVEVIDRSTAMRLDLRACEMLLARHYLVVVRSVAGPTRLGADEWGVLAGRYRSLTAIDRALGHHFRLRTFEASFGRAASALLPELHLGLMLNPGDTALWEPRRVDATAPTTPGASDRQLPRRKGTPEAAATSRTSS